MSTAPPALGVYVHWPYCARICPYCDFNVYRHRGRQAEQAALVDAIAADLVAHRALAGDHTLVSIFFGGGTPSLMAPEIVADIIADARRLFSAVDDLEIDWPSGSKDLFDRIPGDQSIVIREGFRELIQLSRSDD